MKIFKTCIHVLLFTVKSSICCKESTSYSVFYFWRKHIFKRVTDRHGDILIGRGLILNELHIVAMIIVTVIVKHCCGSLSQTCLSPQEPLFALVSTFLLLYYHHPSPPLFHPSHIPENHHKDFHSHNYHRHHPFFFLFITVITATTPAYFCHSRVSDNQ